MQSQIRIIFQDFIKVFSAKMTKTDYRVPHYPYAFLYKLPMLALVG